MKKNVKKKKRKKKLTQNTEHREKATIKQKDRICLLEPINQFVHDLIKVRFLKTGALN